jgi:hypothetical protein
MTRPTPERLNALREAYTQDDDAALIHPCKEIFAEIDCLNDELRRARTELEEYREDNHALRKKLGEESLPVEFMEARDAKRRELNQALDLMEKLYLLLLPRLPEQLLEHDGITVGNVEEFLQARGRLR